MAPSHSLTNSLTKVRYRAARAAKNWFLFFLTIHLTLNNCTNSVSRKCALSFNQAGTNPRVYTFFWTTDIAINASKNCHLQIPIYKLPSTNDYLQISIYQWGSTSSLKIVISSQALREMPSMWGNLSPSLETVGCFYSVCTEAFWAVCFVVCVYILLFVCLFDFS